MNFPKQELGYPPNPTDKSIWEVAPNHFCQYEAKQKTWIRLDGFNAFKSLATPIANGLMSKDDYSKIYDLLLPPPKTTLKSEDCSFAFDKGIFGFRSSSGDLAIDFNLALVAKDPAGKIHEEDQLFHIHENTYGLNFTLNVPQLIDKLTTAGQITFHKEIGPQGNPGEIGDPGIDDLETGQQGIVGTNGKNAPFTGHLISEVLPLDTTTPTKGIIDIKINSISSVENYLIATRANLGNLDYCPEIIQPKMSNTKWVVIIDDGPDNSRKYKQMCALEVCGNQICGTTTMLVPFCSTRLFYIDMADIEDQIKTRFQTVFAEMLAAKQDLARKWIDTMASLYSEQKAALCCALANCQGAQAAVQNQQRIENLRVQLAGTGKQLVISTSPADRQYGNDNTNVIQLPNEGKPFTVELDPTINTDPTHAVEANLPAGNYAATIDDCCLYDTNSQQYSACAMVEYQAISGPNTISLPNVGSYSTQEDANTQYLGLAINFSHAGGPIKLWICGDGYTGKLGLSVNIRTSTGEDSPGSGTAGSEVEVTMTGATCLASPAPEEGTFYCDIAPLQIDWYETAWKTGACCGVYVEAGGIKWLVIKKSIGTDMECGGGESLNTPCIQAAYNFCFHPCIAWPSLDGFGFLGKPTSMQRMYRDVNLEAEIINKIQNDQALLTKGNPKDTFQAVLFPYEP